jgi:subtilisin family serine protease
MNGLTKPDVVAPGTNVVSAYSHIYHPEKHVVASSELDGTLYHWGADSGTSMSAPVVAGVIALWLQANPGLTPDDIRGVLSRTCRQPEQGMGYPNSIYGYGEIDAYRGLLDVLGLTARGAVQGGPFDLVLLDPPYALEASVVTGLVCDLRAAGLLAPCAVILYEHAADAPDLALPGAEVVKAKKRGTTAVTLVRWEA